MNTRERWVWNIRSNNPSAPRSKMQFESLEDALLWQQARFKRQLSEATRPVTEQLTLIHKDFVLCDISIRI